MSLAINGGTPASPEKIPLSKPIIDEKTICDISDVFKSGYLCQGPKTKEFETKFAEYTGSKYAFAVSSGTAALHVSYLSFLKSGDEVLVPPFTFISTVSTLIFSNVKPVFVDINPETFIIDVEELKSKITSKTRAIVPVHLFGNAADMNTLNDISEEFSIKIVSDSCQAHGTKFNNRDLGSFDHLNCYSFYPSKIMTTGEGGIVTTNDRRLYDKGILLRNHGNKHRYHHVILGLNYRMMDLVAVIGINQLLKLDNFLDIRKRIGQKLFKELSKINSIIPQKTTSNVEHSYSYFALRLDTSNLKCTRKKFMDSLIAENINCTIHYPIPITKQPAITNIMEPGVFPVSEDVSNSILSIPMHPGLSDENVKNILFGIEKIVSYYQKR